MGACLVQTFCKGSFGGCQGQPSARPWHLLLRSLGLAALLSSSSVRLCTRGIAYPTHYHIVLFHRLPVIHARLACSLPYTWQYALQYSHFNCGPLFYKHPTKFILYQNKPLRGYYKNFIEKYFSILLKIKYK